MELFVRGTEKDLWQRSAGMFGSLKAAVDAGLEVALQSDNPARDLEDLVGAAWLFKVAGGAMERMFVVSPCPSPAWIEPLRAAGVQRVFLAPKGCGHLFSLETSLEVPADLCPALHLRPSRAAGVTVCGLQQDCVVLSRQHFATQCFGNWRTCEVRGRSHEVTA